MPAKASLKTVEKAGTSGKASRSLRHKRKSRTRTEPYTRYVHKILKEVHPSLSITSEAMSDMNSILYDALDRISNEASRLVRHRKGRLTDHQDVEAVARSVLPRELRNDAIREGKRAVAKYNKAK
ncbi:Histone H2B [Trichuris trichiura]|uniref:Histone H2B n=1 Tax=Trichuris trichiura TaxID=36087 RepID=A0A077ZHQ7_TRITR|nr:Histone H2B [Trichuris trichiura]